MERLKRLREQRGKLITDMRAITEKPQLTAEDQAQYDSLFAEQEKVANEIRTLERQVELDRELAEQQANEERARRGQPGGGGPEPGADGERSQLIMTGFRNYLRGAVTGEGVAEFRSLSAGVQTEGGALVAPQQFVGELIKDLNNKVFVRQRGRVLPPLTAAASLGAPSLDADPDDFDWTTELATGNEDGAMKFGKRELTPHPMAKRIKVSKKLLQIATLPVEGIVRERLGFKLGVTQEKGYLLGDGAAKPLGVYVASNNGISTNRDVVSASQTEISADLLMDAKYSIKAQYREGGNLSWNFHRDGVKKIAKLKDGDGQYIWKAGLTENSPDLLLGYPIDESEYAPNTFTTGKYVGLLGNWQYYWIVDSILLQIQRLQELYAEKNQDGFIARYEGDGMPVLENAFARLKLA